MDPDSRPDSVSKTNHYASPRWMFADLDRLSHHDHQPLLWLPQKPAKVFTRSQGCLLTLLNWRKGPLQEPNPCRLLHPGVSFRTSHGRGQRRAAKTVRPSKRHTQRLKTALELSP